MEGTQIYQMYYKKATKTEGWQVGIVGRQSEEIQFDRYGLKDVEIERERKGKRCRDIQKNWQKEKKKTRRISILNSDSFVYVYVRK